MLNGKTFASVVALAGSMGVCSATMACTMDPPTPPVIHIEQVGPTTYCIWICNYTTAGAGLGTFCSCALNKVGVIANIKDVDVFYSFPKPGGMMPDPCNGGSTLFPVPEWNWNPNSNLAATYQAQAGSGNWEGLLAATSGSVQGGRAVTIKFTINVLPGVTPGQLAGAIDTGDPLFIGTGESNSAGTMLIPGHFSLRSVVLGSATVPALGLAGLAVLGSGFAAAGIVAVRRRSSAA